MVFFSIQNWRLRVKNRWNQFQLDKYIEKNEFSTKRYVKIKKELGEGYDIVNEIEELKMSFSTEEETKTEDEDIQSKPSKKRKLQKKISINQVSLP